MLSDDGNFMVLPVPLLQVQCRATAYHFILGEYIIKICSVKSTITKFPLHAVYFTKHNGTNTTCNDTNKMKPSISSVSKRPPQCANMMRTATSLPIVTTKFVKSFSPSRALFTAKFDHAPHSAKRMRITHLGHLGHESGLMLTFTIQMPA